jgi:hypothetical protein
LLGESWKVGESSRAEEDKERKRSTEITKEQTARSGLDALLVA